MAVDDTVEAGNAALQAGRWDDARAVFELALQERETADALSGIGEALWWLGESRRRVEYHERAYAAFRRAGHADRAAWTAIWIGLTYAADLGNGAAFSGWLARAERVLQDAVGSAVAGWLWLARAYSAGDIGDSQALAERALEIARGRGDVDLELCSLGHLGETLVASGHVDEGLRLIDEAMAGTFGGERNRLDTVVFTSCSMLNACELAADLERATQWCRVADTFIRTYGCPFLHAKCRVGYGSILVATGHWADAERELAAAIRTAQGAYPPLHAVALARLADLRLRQGRLEEAETLLAGVHDGLDCALVEAAIRLARREPEVAVALLQHRFSDPDECPVEAAPALGLLVEAHLADGDVEAAAAVAERLSRLAGRIDREHVTARAAIACARVSAAGGDLDAAIALLDGAVERLSRLDLPPETARARLELARALARDQLPLAVVEARAALAAFERLGASADADAAFALLRSWGALSRTGPRGVGTLTRREQEVLRLVGLGYSNPEIAQRLVISRKTASHHVSSVLAKLGLRNRAEAVAYATRISGDLALP